MNGAVLGSRRVILRKLLLPAVLVVLACVVLAALGAWQLARMAGKDVLIAEISTRTTAPPVPLPPVAAWNGLAPDEYAYRHVRVDGVFEAGKTVFVFRPAGLGAAKTAGPGYLVMAPLRLASGAYVVVDRGFVSPALRDSAATPPAGPQTVTGLMRPPEPRNAFTPADDPARGLWFTRDPAAIATALGLQPVAPFSIDVDLTPAGTWPKGGQTVMAIPNDHLVYAMTWFGLALTAIGVFVVYAITRLRPVA